MVVAAVVEVVVGIVVAMPAEVGAAAAEGDPVVDDPWFVAWQMGSRHPSFFIIAPLPLFALLTASHNDSVRSLVLLK